jgi:hypothetical protein
MRSIAKQKAFSVAAIARTVRSRADLHATFTEKWRNSHAAYPDTTTERRVPLVRR